MTEKKKTRLERAIENADGQDLYECQECGTYWVHVGDFACKSCGSKDAAAVDTSLTKGD